MGATAQRKRILLAPPRLWVKNCGLTELVSFFVDFNFRLIQNAALWTL